MYKLEFGEELFIIIIYKKIFRDLVLTCVKEFYDPAMILEKEKSRTSALTCAHTHALTQRKASDFSLFNSSHFLGVGGRGGECFLKQALIFMDSSRYTKVQSSVCIQIFLAGQFGLKTDPFLSQSCLFRFFIDSFGKWSIKDISFKEFCCWMFWIQAYFKS